MGFQKTEQNRNGTPHNPGPETTGDVTQRSHAASLGLDNKKRKKLNI